MERDDLPIISHPADFAIPATPKQRGDEDDPERLLREYTDRQKSKVARLEQDLAEAGKVAAERDALRVKVTALQAELADVKKKLDDGAKHEGIVKDLQEKIDAALLSHGMIGAENAKLKMRLQEVESGLLRHEERVTKAEARAAQAERSLLSKTEALQEAESRVTAALHALQPKQNGKVAAPTSPILRR